MPKTITIESLQEFIKRHGGDPMPFAGNKEAQLRGGDAPNVLLLPDGARYKDTDVGDIPMYEPPEDPLELLKARLDYAIALVEHVEKQFQDLQTNLQLQCRYYVTGMGPLPGPEDLEVLEACKRKLAEAEATRDVLALKYDELRPPTPAELQAERKAERVKEAQDFMRKLYAITETTPEDLEKSDEAVEAVKARLGEELEKMTAMLNQAADRRRR